MKKTHGLFRDMKTQELLHMVELSHPESSCYCQGNTVWVAVEGTKRLDIKTFLVNTDDPKSMADFEALKAA